MCAKMVSERAKRNIVPPKKLDLEDYDNKRLKPRDVLRFLTRDDVRRDLTERDVFLLWPDTGVWYQAFITKINDKTGHCHVEYHETGEEEDVEIHQLISGQEIAFKETRPGNVRLRRGLEVPADEANAVGALYDDEPDPTEQQLQQLLNSDDDDEGSSDDEGGGRRRHGRQGRSNQQEGPAGMLLVSGFQQQLLPTAAEPNAKRQKVESATAFAGPAVQGLHRIDPSVFLNQQAGLLPGSMVPQAFVPGAGMVPLPNLQQGAALPAGMIPIQQPANLLGLAQRPAAAAGGGAAGGSARAARRRASAQLADDDDDDEEEDPTLTQNVLATLLRRSDSQHSGGTPRGRGPARNGSTMSRAGSAASNEQIRGKAREQLAAALSKAVEELKAEGHDGQLADPTAVAADIEMQLFRLEGTIGAQYKAKFRSLQFNLKDPNNPQLRARVLTGDLQPGPLARMEASELASRELVQWRKQREEEHDKELVLDAEAAAKFSTAAAAALRDEIMRKRETTPPPAAAAAATATATAADGAAAEEPQEAAGADHEGQHTSLGRHNYTAQCTSGGDEAGSADEEQQQHQEDGEQQEGQEYAMTDVDFGEQQEGQQPGTPVHQDDGDDDQQQAAAAAAGAQVPADGSKPPATKLAARPAAKPVSGTNSKAASTATQPMFDWAAIKNEALQSIKSSDAEQQEQQEEEEQLPSELQMLAQAEQALAQQAEPSALASAASMDDAIPDLLPIVAPASDRHAGTQADVGARVWSGRLNNPGMGSFGVAVTYLSGMGDLGAMLGALGAAELDIKGRLDLGRFEQFLEDMRKSRSRTVTLGVVQLADSSAAADLVFMNEVIRTLGNKQRTGVLHLAAGLEGYLLPKGDLSARLARTAQLVAEPQEAAGLPKNVLPGELLLLLIHKREWAPAVPKTKPAATAGPAAPVVGPPAPPPKHSLPAAAQAAAPAAPGQQAPLLAPAAVGPPPPPPPASTAPAAPAPAPAAAAAMGLDLDALNQLAASFGVAPGNAAPHAAAAPQPMAAPAPGPGADPLQQLLNTLVPAASRARGQQMMPAGQQMHAPAGAPPMQQQYPAGAQAPYPGAPPPPYAGAAPGMAPTQQHPQGMQPLQMPAPGPAYPQGPFPPAGAAPGWPPPGQQPGPPMMGGEPRPAPMTRISSSIEAEAASVLAAAVGAPAAGPGPAGPMRREAAPGPAGPMRRQGPPGPMIRGPHDYRGGYGGYGEPGGDGHMYDGSPGRGRGRGGRHWDHGRGPWRGGGGGGRYGSGR